MSITKIVFLLEEPSMKEVLNVIVPKILPPSVHFTLIPHDGKSDLEKSIPRKLKAWREKGVRFVVVRDKDSGDCVKLKARLVKLCKDSGRADTLVRIVVHELEAWYIGDLDAVASAYELPALPQLKNKAKYRDPDSVANASEEIKKLVPEFQKMSGAAAIAPHMDIQRNSSHSFKVFVDGVRRISTTSHPKAVVVKRKHS